MVNIKEIRDQFPILGEKIYGNDFVYLDNAATTQRPELVINTSRELYEKINGNIHRGIHYMAERTTEMYENARIIVRDFLGASSCSEIIFTSGATASINLVAYSFCEKYLREGDNVVVTEMEHHSNLVPWQIQAERRSASLRYIPVNDDGTLHLESLDSLLDARTRIVALTETSNVLGTNNDIERVVSYCHERNIPVLVDGSQAIQHKKIDVKKTDVDFYAFSGHKIFSPTGIGVLYGKEKWLEQMPPFLSGGDMISSVSLTKGTTWASLPLKFEAGTSNYMGAIALGTAINWYKQYHKSDVSDYLAKLTGLFSSRLKSEIDGVRIYGETKDKAPIVSFNIEGCFPMDIAQIIDKFGVAVRSGTQCAEPLMTRFGVSSVCRASMAIYNTENEIDAAVDALKTAVKMLRRRKLKFRK